MTQHEQIIETFNTYLVEAESFDTKGVKAAATRARKALQEMGKLIKARRKEIIDEKAALTNS